MREFLLLFFLLKALLKSVRVRKKCKSAVVVVGNRVPSFLSFPFHNEACPCCCSAAVLEWREIDEILNGREVTRSLSHTTHTAQSAEIVQ